MAQPARWALGSLLAGGLAYRFRKKLVHLLTRTTGTWVGSPDG